jgi:methyltransferase
VVTAWIFIVFVLLLTLQRLAELRLSRRNEVFLLGQGGEEHVPEQFVVMKVLHVSWLISMIVEVFLFRRPFLPVLALAAFLVIFIGQSLRYAAIHTLGRRWTVRVITLPAEPPIRHGIYRVLRHPNYLGVILEIIAVPLLHSAFLTAIFFSTANLFLLKARIQSEEKALDKYFSTGPDHQAQCHPGSETSLKE